MDLILLRDKVNAQKPVAMCVVCTPKGELEDVRAVSMVQPLLSSLALSSHSRNKACIHQEQGAVGSVHILCSQADATDLQEAEDVTEHNEARREDMSEHFRCLFGPLLFGSVTVHIISPCRCLPDVSSQGASPKSVLRSVFLLSVLFVSVDPPLTP